MRSSLASSIIHCKRANKGLKMQICNALLVVSWLGQMHGPPVASVITTWATCILNSTINRALYALSGRQQSRSVSPNRIAGWGCSRLLSSLATLASFTASAPYSARVVMVAKVRERVGVESAASISFMSSVLRVASMLAPFRPIVQMKRALRSLYGAPYHSQKPRIASLSTIMESRAGQCNLSRCYLRLEWDIT